MSAISCKPLSTYQAIPSGALIESLGNAGQEFKSAASSLPSVKEADGTGRAHIMLRLKGTYSNVGAHLELTLKETYGTALAHIMLNLKAKRVVPQ